MKNKTNRSDYVGAILILLMGILVFALIGCAIFSYIKVVDLGIMIAYAICSIKLITLIGTTKENKYLTYVITFILFELVQLVPYLIILAIKRIF